MINSINFGAKLINTAQIKKLNPQDKLFHPQKVSIAEFEPDNIEDVFALTLAAKDWIYDKYASAISFTAHCIFRNSLDKNKHKVFLLTEQLNDLKSLDKNKILGMAEIEKTGEKSIELNHIQANTNYDIFSNEFYYKEVGTRILDTLKSLYDKIELTAARGSVKNFYIKNGFKNTDSPKNRYIWEKA